MIEASFGRTGRGATVDGAYQYDTGQRLRMHGLPSPDELAERDDFLDGDRVAVEAQYSFAGDSNTEARIAQWDEMEGAWIAEVPDVYLRRSADVHMYVYVSYGSTEESMRTKTCYEAVFRPIGRPAPKDDVTPAQKNEWQSLKDEANLTIAETKTAASNANSEATAAHEATARANKIAEELEKLDAEAESVDPDESASAYIGVKDGHKQIFIKVPRGKDGKPGVFEVNGVTVPEDGKITLTPEDIGAMPDTYKASVEFKVLISPNGVANPPYAEVIDVYGIRETDTPIVDVDLSALLTLDHVEEVLESFSFISKI